MRSIITAAALALAAASAPAEVISQQFDYAWDFQGEDNFGSFQQFDDMGGTRTLTDVRLSMDGIYSLAFIFENGSGAPLLAGDYDPSPNTVGNIFPLNAELFLENIAADYQPLVAVDLARTSRGLGRILAAALLLGVVAKAVYETLSAAAVFTTSVDMGGETIYAAHLLGAAAGLLLAFAMRGAGEATDR